MTINWEPPSLSSFFTFEKKTKKRRGAGRLIVVFYIWEKNQEMTMNLSALYHLLHLRQKKQRDDDELRRFAIICYTWKKNKEMTMSQGGSPSFVTLEEKNKMTTSLLACWHLLHLRKKNKEMTTSQGGLLSSTTLEKKNKKMTMS